MKIVIALLIILLVILAFIAGLFNSLVVRKNLVKNAMAQIDTQLKRRYDLIPNLVECVKQYMQYEESLLAKITELRSDYKNDDTIENKENNVNEFNRAINELYVNVEKYPDLKANVNFLKLQDELSNTENKVAYARQFYNDSVFKYNSTIQMFPTNIIANMFGFKEEKMFVIEDEERKNVTVKM